MLLSAPEGTAGTDGAEAFATFFSAAAETPADSTLTWPTLLESLVTFAKLGEDSAAGGEEGATKPPPTSSGATASSAPHSEAEAAAAAAVRAVRDIFTGGIGKLLVSRETCGTSCSGVNCDPADLPAAVADAEKEAFNTLFAQLEDTWIFKQLCGDGSDGGVATGNGEGSSEGGGDCGDCVCDGDGHGGSASVREASSGDGPSSAPVAAAAGTRKALQKLHSDTLALLSLPFEVWTEALAAVPSASSIITDCSEGCCKPGPPLSTEVQRLRVQFKALLSSPD